MSNWSGASATDRLDGVRRDAEAVAELWRGASLLPIDDRGRFRVAGVTEGDPWGTSNDVVLGARPAAAESAPAAALTLGEATGAYDSSRHWLLGRDGDRVVFAEQVGEPVDGFTLREAGPLLTAAEAEYAAMASALAAWHAAERFCPKCGTPTVVAGAGAVRHCPSCGQDRFPRTDPAIIVAITDPDDRLLLARQGVWATGRHSVLAGFVEAGESLEQTVHREVFEESGIRLASVEYFGSQPWPFPRSVMLGFRARAATGAITVDGEEIVSARWFTREGLLEEVAAGTVILPGEASIAFRLVRDWLGQTAS